MQTETRHGFSTMVTVHALHDCYNIFYFKLRRRFFFTFEMGRVHYLQQEENKQSNRLNSMTQPTWLKLNYWYDNNKLMLISNRENSGALVEIICALVQIFYWQNLRFHNHLSHFWTTMPIMICCDCFALHWRQRMSQTYGWFNSIYILIVSKSPISRRLRRRQQLFLLTHWNTDDNCIYSLSVTGEHKWGSEFLWL